MLAGSDHFFCFVPLGLVAHLGLSRDALTQLLLIVVRPARIVTTAAIWRVERQLIWCPQYPHATLHSFKCIAS